MPDGKDGNTVTGTHAMGRWPAIGPWLRRFAAALAEPFQSAKPPAGETALDGAAAEQLARRILDTYGNSILRLAYAYLHNLSDAEEVLQDTVLRRISKAPTFDGEAHEKAWLLRVAANLSKNRILYNRRHSADALDESLRAEGREDLSFVWEAVRELPVRQREAVHLFYGEGYATGEIAELLGRKEATVRSDLHRARLGLREILREGYDFEDL